VFAWTESDVGHDAVMPGSLAEWGRLLRWQLCGNYDGSVADWRHTSVS
jgi:hypothetical protein